MAIKVNKSEVAKLMATLDLTEEDATELWLCDHDLSDNEEQNELDIKAKSVKVDHETVNKNKGTKKVVTKKVSDEKVALFETVMTALAEYSPIVEKAHQTIGVVCGDKTYSINFVEHRPKK